MGSVITSFCLASLGVLAGAIAVGASHPAMAQEVESELLAVGEMAPDFALAGATRYGLLADPIRLGDYLGETVVLAFFYRVRTPG